MTTERKIFTDVQPEDELMPSEISAIEAEVQKEIEKELKQAAKDKLREQLRKEARATRGIDEPYEDVTIDLAPYCDRILLDNKAFLQGVTYNVRASQAASIREIMQNTWGHQSVVDGKSENFYRKTRGAAVTPHGVINSRSALLRA